MKKILFASTALVAAGLMTTGTASASEKVKLQLGGFSKWWVVGAWNQGSYQSLGAASKGSYNNVDVKGDNEVHFIGSTTLDNGLKVGVQIELEAGGHTDQSTDTIDASFAFVEGGWGKVLLGTANNGTYLLHVMAPDAAGNWGEGGIMTSDVAVARPTAVTGMLGGNTTAIVTDNKADKITYVAPTFYGLTLGGSYIPNLTEDNRGVTNATTGSLTSTLYGNPTIGSAAYPALQGQAYGVGGLYANTFGGVGVKVSGGYVQYDVHTVFGQSSEWSAGTQLSYNGFTVGGSYRNTNLNFKGSQQSSSINVQGTAVSPEGHAFDAGIQYANGPYAVSFAYFHSEVAGTTGTGAGLTEGKDKIDAYQVSGKYTLGAGVDLLASGGYIKYQDGDAASTSGADANNNKGWTVMTGLSLAF